MKLSDVLANLRARLRDDNAALTKTGDSFLTSLVYFWQNQILAEFELNLCEICVNLDEKDEIELPFEILRVVAIYLNNEPLKLTSHATAARQRNLNELLVFEKSPQIYGLSRKSSGEIALYAVKKAFVKDKDDEMILSDDFINLLVLSVFLDLQKTQASPDNLQKINFYEQVVDKERQRITAFINHKNAPQSFKSPLIRV